MSVLFGMKSNIPSSTLPYDLSISTPRGETVRVRVCYVDCELSLDGKIFLATLIPLPIMEFDVILGMDFLSTYRARIDCLRKEVTFGLPTGEKIKFYGEKRAVQCRVISSLKARVLLSKGCEGFIAHVVDSSQSNPSVEDIPVVRDFPDVFPEELPGVVPDRDIEFTIELVPSANPISIAPYRMAPAELLELKVQLSDYLDKGFIRPSMSPWGLQFFR